MRAFENTLRSFTGILAFPFSFSLPSKLQKGFAAGTFSPARTEDFPRLDRGELERYSEAFARLGFQPVADVTATNSTHDINGFMRLLAHDGENAWVSLHQAFPNIGRQPLKCALISPLSEGWNCTATDREAHPILSQLRLPRNVWLRDCDATPEQLWHAHLAQRAALMRDLNLQTLPDLSVDAFVRHSRATNNEISELASRQNGFVFLLRMELLKVSPSRRDMWRGDWKPKPP